MISVIVTFQYENQFDPSVVTKVASGARTLFEGMPGLRYKFFTLDERRSQLQSRELALERLRSILTEALAIERPRVATKPSRSAKVKRVESKRRRSDVKRGRQTPRSDD